MTSSTLTIRIDQDLKNDAASIVEAYGLDLSSVTRAFLTQIVSTGTVPLSFNYLQPNAATLASAREARTIIDHGESRFASAEEMFEALEI